MKCVCMRMIPDLQEKNKQIFLDPSVDQPPNHPIENF